MNLFKIFIKNKETSKDIAKERLQLVLVHDRCDLSPETIEKIRKEIIDVISKYIEIDKEELSEVKFEKNKHKDGLNSSIVTSIPVKIK